MMFLVDAGIEPGLMEEPMDVEEAHLRRPKCQRVCLVVRQLHLLTSVHKRQNHHVVMVSNAPGSGRSVL